MPRLATLLLLAPCLFAAVQFGTDKQLLDLTQHDWQYIPEGGAGTPEQAEASKDWKPVRVGRRWDEMGYPELKKGNFWVRVRFAAAPALRGRKVGFFATLIDDQADIYLNGRLISSVKYRLGALVPGPAIADLTAHLRPGAENTLLLHIRDTYVRSQGVIGNVCLFQSLPFERTKLGGISTQASGPLSVVLHAGDALLSRSGSTSFTAAELSAIEAPPYILREDELVLLAPAKEISTPPRYRVDLDAVNQIHSERPLAIGAPKLPSEVPLFTLLDLPLDVAATFDNPFDPRQVNVQALIETPSGKIDKVAAFFRQDFRQEAPSDEEEILLPVKGPAWRVYYRPREPGRHKVEIIAQDRSGIRRHDAGGFECTPSKLPGYLRVSKRDPSFFEYDNGDTFFGIGPSGWYRGRDFIFGGATRWVSSRKLAQYYERKAANGSNYEYLGSFHFGRLLTNGGIIDQHIAWKLEYELRTMERLGIRWLFFHDDICRMTQYGLDAVPYAAANGGPARDVNQLYFSQSVMDLQRNALRYLVGRMADSPSLWIWNIGDEWRHQVGTKFSVAMVRSWITELHAYVKEIDVYRHPHAIGEGPSSILNGGDVYILEDWYLNHVLNPGADWKKGPRHDLFDLAVKQVESIGDRRFPTINVEGGLYAWNTLVYQSGKPWDYPEAITFHQHLWLGLFLKNAASGTDWLVNVLDRDNNLFHAKALAQYLRGENLTAKPFSQAEASTSDPRLTAVALRNSDRTLSWVVNRTWNWLDHVNGRKPQPLSRQSVTIPVAAAGKYRVEIWNTQSGVVDSVHSIGTSGAGLTVPLPEITTDFALKAIRHD